MCQGNRNGREESLRRWRHASGKGKEWSRIAWDALLLGRARREGIYTSTLWCCPVSDGLSRKGKTKEGEREF